MQTVAILGASGFLGKNLTSYLLTQTDASVKAISHHQPAIHVDPEYEDRLTLIQGDIFDTDRLTQELEGVDVAYYFVHMMGQKGGNFYDRELAAAKSFSTAVRSAKVGRVIYMGGLGDDTTPLSEHLAARHKTGQILRGGCPLVLEFRASMIIGRGSVAFDIIDSLVRKLPIMALPSFAGTLTQPIGLRDTLRYLTAAATIELPASTVVEIGGQEKLSYRDLYKRYARWLGRRQVLVPVPFVPEGLAGHWLDLFTPPVHARIGRIMVASMANRMTVRDPAPARRLFPGITPEPLNQIFDDISDVDRYDRTRGSLGRE